LAILGHPRASSVGIRAPPRTALASDRVPAVTSLWRDLSVRARVGVALAAGVVLLGLPALLLGPVVRAKVSARAATRGLVVEIGRVRPGWDGIWLLDVAVRSRTGRVAGTVDAVRVPFGDRAVAVHGGRLVLRGTADELERELSSAGPVEGPGGRRLVTADGIAVVLLEADRRGSGLHAWGVGGAREPEGDRISASLVQVTVPGGHWALRGVDVRLGARGPGRLRSVRMAEADLGVDLGALRATAGAGAMGGATPSPAPVTKVGVALALPAVAGLAKQALPEGAGVEIASTRVLATYRGEHLGFGPSRVSVRRADHMLTLEVTPSEGASRGTTPLALRGKLPLGAGAPSLELEGGPVSLAALGVRDGELGLTHTREATLEAHLKLELEGGVVRAAGSGAL